MQEPPDRSLPKQGRARVVDGRRLRSERSRQAILDATLALIGENNLVPSAQQIAGRAGVGIRTLFRQFADMESLFTAVEEQSRDSHGSIFPREVPEGDLQDRVQHVVQCLAEAYEVLKNVLVSAQAQHWRYANLKRNYARCQRKIHRELDKRLPELRSMSRNRREAAAAVTSFEMWHRLRECQGLSKKASVAITAELLADLIDNS